jgi:hypothetical protein
VRASVPRIIFFGPAPLYYSSVGFGPSNHFLWASSASILFECGLRSLESFSSGQQRLYIIRVRASVPRIVLFGPAAPLCYSTVGFGPSNYSLRASSASALFEYRLRPLELFSLGQQRLYIIRVWVSDPSNRIFRPSVLSFYSDMDRCPSNLYFMLSMLLNCPKYGGNIPIRMSYVKYEGKSTVGNTRWPDIRIKRALPRNFPYLLTRV